MRNRPEEMAKEAARWPACEIDCRPHHGPPGQSTSTLYGTPTAGHLNQLAYVRMRVAADGHHDIAVRAISVHLGDPGAIYVLKALEPATSGPQARFGSHRPAYTEAESTSWRTGSSRRGTVLRETFALYEMAKEGVDLKVLMAAE